ncbi:MAG: hypothetical protein IJ659_09310 [Alloprevotella sp.]|nr:hypothetical protein [Alloprevotella sp.]MBR1594951.1 hypothetical protein [Alloprevotella sp.]
MKKFISFAAYALMLAASAFTLTACGGDDDDDDGYLYQFGKVKSNATSSDLIPYRGQVIAWKFGAYSIIPNTSNPTEGTFNLNSHPYPYKFLNAESFSVNDVLSTRLEKPVTYTVIEL